MPTPHAVPINLTAHQKSDLNRLARAHSTPQAIVRRVQIVLCANEPERPTNLEIADRLGVNKDTVACWRKRFAESGLQGLLDLPRTGRPPVFSPLGTCDCD